MKSCNKSCCGKRLLHDDWTSLGTDQEEALSVSTVLRKVPDHLHHQNILQFHGTFHQHLQTIT